MATVGLFGYSGQARNDVPQNVIQIKVESGIKGIPDWMFDNLESLREIELPERLETIGDHVFFRCVSLEKVMLPTSLIEIGNNAFEGCSTLKDVGLPDGLKRIGAATFRSCTELRRMKIPATVTHIGTCAFAGCSSLASIDLRASLNFVNGWFHRCDSLKMVTLPPYIHSIAPHAFYNCRSLVSLEIPDGVTSIWGGSFAECSLLRNIFIPSSVILLEAIFDGCTQLQEIFPGGNARIDALKNRFDGLPIHKICYFQSHHKMDLAVRKVRHAITNNDTIKTDLQDTLGMTCMHILALSVKPNFRLWNELLEISPKKTLEVADKWGSFPIDYLIANTAPGSIALLRSTIQAMTSRRLVSLGLARWKMEVLKLVENLSNDNDRRCQVEQIFEELAKYERLEALSLLELALWKFKVDGLLSARSSEGRPKKKVKIRKAAYIGACVLDFDDRRACRINCGADVIIPNVSLFVGRETVQ